MYPQSQFSHTGRLVLKKTVSSVWASALNMGLINKGTKVDMVCFLPVRYMYGI